MAAILVAVAFAVLVGYLVPLLIQIRKTAAESEQLVTRLSSELPTLIAELRAMSQNLNDVTGHARTGSSMPQSYSRYGRGGRIGESGP
ncbi:MAG: DUF948 domain-containing protein [Nitrospira sp.]|nr:DUF948 domain-containing protein [Nitrospira sp.]